MTPVRSVRSRFSGYQPREPVGAASSFDAGEAAAFEYLRNAGIETGDATGAGGAPAFGTGYAGPTTNPGAGMFDAGNDWGRDSGDPSPWSASEVNINTMSDQQLTDYYHQQNALTGFMGTPGGMALRGLAGMALPGVGSFFTAMQNPIMRAYQNEMAKRGLLAGAFQAPASGEWNSRDARGFDLGFYGIGDNALNAAGGPFEGQRTTVSGGNPATTGNALERASLPSFDWGGGNDDRGWGGGFNTGNDWGDSHGGLY